MLDRICKRVIAWAMSVVLVAAGFAVPSSAHAASLSLAAGGLKVAPQAALKTQDQADMTVFGIDVSRWQGSISWKKTAKAVSFAIIQCGYGNDLKTQDDSRWADNVKGCQDNGVPFGVYLYSYATNTTMAKSEANHVIRCLKDVGLDSTKLQLPIFLDMEDATTNNLKHSKYKAIFDAFKQKLNAAGYSNVGVYANASWWAGNLSDIELNSEYRWVAQWGPTLFKGYESLSEKGCGIWQYTDKGKVSGISGAVDGNYAHKDWPFLSGVPVEADDAAALAGVSVYKMYRSKTKDYIYTTSETERARLLKNKWKDKGVLCQVPETSGKPVYRLYNSKKKAHYYTISKSKRKSLARKKQWAYQGIAFYSQTSKLGKPIYRFTKSGKYRFTTSKKLKGWKKNSVGWYAMK